MNDTAPAVQAEYRALLMARPEVERFLMAVGMFDTARALVLASFPPGLSSDEIRLRLFERFYGDMPKEHWPAELRLGRSSGCGISENDKVAIIRSSV